MDKVFLRLKHDVITRHTSMLESNVQHDLKLKLMNKFYKIHNDITPRHIILEQVLLGERETRI